MAANQPRDTPPRRLSPKQLVLKKYPVARLTLASAGYEIRSCGSPQLACFGEGDTARAAWADAARKL